MRPMTIVIVESPFSCPTRTRDECMRYAQFAMLDCLQRGECPFASHLFFTAILPEDTSREVGLTCRDRIAKATGGVVARYVDLGTTPGMFRGVDCTAVAEERRLPSELLLRWQRGEHLRGSLVLDTVERAAKIAGILTRQDETIAELRAQIAVLEGRRP